MLTRATDGNTTLEYYCFYGTLHETGNGTSDVIGVWKRGLRGSLCLSLVVAVATAAPGWMARTVPLGGDKVEAC
eukprot:1317300-Amorphochlora_amoeboformis.AAC.2